MHQPDAQLRRHDGFHSTYLDHDRDVVVWLPPGYDGSDARYPALYMHDGQNLFEPETSFRKGEYWRIGETAAALIDEGRLDPIIIVGVYNTGDHRADEYTPTRDAKLGGGHAGDYGRMIVEELKPMIDRTYRTRTDRESTAMAGSSLGGLLTLYLGFTHPAVFGRIAALSPSVWWDKRAVLKTIRQARSKPRLRIWTDMGTAEGRRGLEDARLLKAALIGLGFKQGQDFHYAEYEGATHSEQSWAERAPQMLQWLFPRT
jgi:predicted alpha/beta superfamily hydrolase